MRRFLRKVSTSLPSTTSIKSSILRSPLFHLGNLELSNALKNPGFSSFFKSYNANQTHSEFLERTILRSKKNKNKDKKGQEEEEDIDDAYSSDSIRPKDRSYYKSIKIGLMVILGLRLLWEVFDRESPEMLINDLVKELKEDNVNLVRIHRKQGKYSIFYAVVELREGGNRTLYLGMEIESLLKLVRRFGVRIQTNMTPPSVGGIANHLELISLKFFDSLLVIAMILFFLQKKKNTYNWAQTKILRNKSNIKFNQVAGIDEVLVEMTEFVDYLKRPKIYQAMGAKIPKGALLSGPPGTGKTLLVKACAGEAEVPFFSVSGSDFVEMFGGLGASRVREIFAMAKEYSPCIIFIDEIDAIGKKRDSFDMVGERDQTLNQLLTEMDGFGSEAGKVIVFAATNQPDVLDSALIRPGRFDRNIQVTLPDLNGRKEILKVHLKDKVTNSKSFEKSESIKKEQGFNLMLNHLAAISAGFSGADLENLTNEAAILAARENETQIFKKHFEAALERIIGGVDSPDKEVSHLRVRSALVKSATVVTSWFLELTDPVVRVNLIPRSKQKTGSMQVIKEDVNLQTTEELLQRIQVSIAGKLAEEKFYEGDVSTVSNNGLKKAYRIARAMVTSYGMDPGLENIYLKEDDFRLYSQHTAETIDHAVEVIITEQAKKAGELISTHWESIEQLKKTLEEKNFIDLADITEVLGKRPGVARPNFAEYRTYAI